MKNIKKFFTSFIISLLLLSISFTNVFTPLAQAQWYSPTFAEFTEVVFDEDNEDEIFGERYTYAQVVWIVHSITAIIFPDWLLNCWAAREDATRWVDCITDIGDQLIGQEPAVTGDTFAQRLDSILSQNPISGYGYVKQRLAKFHIIPEVQAQQTGFGFRSLQPIQPMWAAVRNISYFLLIIVFIAMAFMIMFKVKMSPQTIITVQSALPRLVVILILITFSYAIAGFIIDLSYVVLGLFSVLVTGSGIGDNITGLSALEVFSTMSGLRPIQGIMTVLVIYALIISLGLGVSSVLIFGFGLFAFITGVILLVLIAILFIIAAIKVLWLMLKTLINIMLLIVAAPVLILMGAFPGTGGMGSWLRKLASHVAVFPVIQIMLFLANYFFWGFAGDSPHALLDLIAGTWINPFDIRIAFSEPIWLPGFSMGSGTAGFLIAIGILLLIPKVGEMIQSFIAGKPFSTGTGMREAMGPAMMAGGAYRTWGAGRAADYFETTAPRSPYTGKAVGWRGGLSSAFKQIAGKR